MHLSFVLAGAQRRLVGVRHRLGAFLTETPLLFIATVVTIALLFRVAIGMLRPATSEDEVASPSAESPPAKASEPRTASTSSPSPHPAAPEIRGEGGSAGVDHGKKSHESPRQRPRTHGRR